ncbi:MAG: carbohydrate binding family 9 domain-containing protein [Bacteroidia bacterium]|nr:carbohydrate binding family 9 domain-containing protein [Bacteroidia bacterium]
MKSLPFLLCLCALSSVSYSQNFLPISKTRVPVRVDGVLDEQVWNSNIQKAGRFWQNYPSDTSLALSETEVMVSYDDNFLYVAAICYDSLPGSYISQSLKRDFSYPVNDAFAVFFDPFNDKTNGYNFTVSPLGVQREGLVATGGGMGVSTDWDCTWYSAVQQHKDRWTLEMAIPFRVLKFSKRLDSWGINFARNDLKRNESSVWSRVPKNFNIASLAYTGLLKWDHPPDKEGSGIALIPYLSGNASFDHVSDSLWRIKPNGGMDAKIPVSNSLNLDVTVNPDFSQVEVDRQVTNLTRFSIFFPEKRQFFIENSDLFDRFGFRQIRPFFSRRIGLFNGEVIPIYGGLRLSGKINKFWRIGLMDMQTAAHKKTGQPSENFGVFAIQRTTFKRSNIAFIAVNRYTFPDSSLPSSANTILGVDYNLNSANNHWLGKAFFHYSLNDVNDSDNFSHATFLRYDNGNWGLEWNHEYVGMNYLAATGFVPRNVQTDAINGLSIYKPYWRLDESVNRNWYPKSKWINKHGPKIIYSQYLDEAFNSTELLLTFSYNLKFQSGHEVNALTFRNEIFLPWLTDVSFSTGEDTLPQGYYRFWNYELNWKTTERKLFYMLGRINYGNYYTGKKLSLSADITYRIQPWGSFTAYFSQDELDMPDPLTDASISLIGTRIEFSFSRNLFFSTFIQYNTQANNINLNARIQWRYAPLSDLYIVYTDNRYSTDFGPKYQGLVLKLNYWLNL